MTQDSTTSQNTLTQFSWKSVSKSYTDKYDNLDKKFAGVYSKSAERLGSLADLKSGQIVIDLGCGTGTSTKIFWKMVAPAGSIVGIDISPEMIKKAREKFCQNTEVKLLADDAFNIRKICEQLNLMGKVDTIFSNFTYYYMYEKREQLQKDIFACLKPGGKWAFNITSYLSRIKDKNKIYNTFFSHFDQAVQKILVEKNFVKKLRQTASRSKSLTSASWDKKLLKEIGFSKVESEAWPLPITPSQGVAFTIEGFYKFGSKTVFSEPLMELSLEDRVLVLEDALATSRQALDKTGQHPTILNVAATK